MDTRSYSLCLTAIFAAMLLARASAQSGSCTSALINLAPCLNYITGNETTPSSSCCSQLSNVVSQEPQCLCTVLNGGTSSLGITINQTQALQLPKACNVQTPPVSKCNGGGGSPTGSPTTPSSDSPSVPTVPSGSGSKTTPTGDSGSSDGTSVHTSFSMIIASLLAAAYLSMPSTSFSTF